MSIGAKHEVHESHWSVRLFHIQETENYLSLYP